MDTSTFSTRTSIAGVLATFYLTLVGCGGGGDSSAPSTPPPPSSPSGGINVLIAPPEGYWQGTITDAQGVQRSARLFGTESGEFQLFMSPQALLASTGFVAAFNTDWLVAYGEKCCSTVSLPLTTMQTSGAQTPGQILNTSNEGQVLKGEIVSGSARYAFSVTREAASAALSLATLAGTYTGYTAAYQTTPLNWVLTIEANGRVTGSDDYGCQWAGNATVSGANVFKLALTASGCSSNTLAPKNGDYVALGRWLDAQASKPLFAGQATIEFATFGPAWVGYRTLAR